MRRGMGVSPRESQGVNVKDEERVRTRRPTDPHVRTPVHRHPISIPCHFTLFQWVFRHIA